MAQYGALKGMALPLLFFPFSVLTALSGLLMPEITRAHTRGDAAAARRLVFTMLRFTGGFSVLAGAGFVLLGAPLAELVYRDAMVGRYVQILGLAAPFMYLESMVDGVLKGWGSSWLPSGIRCWIRCSASQPSGLCCRSTAWQASCGL